MGGFEVKYLLDTHVWIWMLEASSELPRSIQVLLKDISHAPLGVSAISPWEIAKKTALGKLTLSMPAREWITQSISSPGVKLLPLTPEIAWESNYLPPSFHKDPADQIVVATARLHKLTVITSDEKILGYPHVSSLWG